MLDRFRKKPNRKDRELAADMQEYLQECRAVSIKHGMELVACLQITENGVKPILKIKQIPKAEPHGNGEAEKSV
jgi:hypothetical protein